jgi:hypothetical protein
MAITPLGSVGPASISGAAPTQKVGESFSKVLKSQPRLENTPLPAQPSAIRAQATPAVQPGACRAATPSLAAPAQVSAAQVVERVSQAQQRMEQILRAAESGRSFSPAELLSLQTHVYRASQELDLAGKVVEKATGGVKQVLQTQM